MSPKLAVESLLGREKSPEQTCASLRCIRTLVTDEDHVRISMTSKTQHGPRPQPCPKSGRPGKGLTDRSFPCRTASDLLLMLDDGGGGAVWQSESLSIDRWSWPVAKGRRPRARAPARGAGGPDLLSRAATRTGAGLFTGAVGAWIVISGLLARRWPWQLYGDQASQSEVLKLALRVSAAGGAAIALVVNYYRQQLLARDDTGGCGSKIKGSRRGEERGAR
jgi:hypothetical protein